MADYSNPMKGSPLEVKVLTSRFGIPNSASIDVYLAHEGYQGLKKALAMKPDDVINEVKKFKIEVKNREYWNRSFRPF